MGGLETRFASMAAAGALGPVSGPWYLSEEELQHLRLEEEAGRRMAEGFNVDWAEAASGKEVLINLEELAHKFGKTEDAKKPAKWLKYDGTKRAFESGLFVPSHFSHLAGFLASTVFPNLCASSSRLTRT